MEETSSVEKILLYLETVESDVDFHSISQVRLIKFIIKLFQASSKFRL